MMDSSARLRGGLCAVAGAIVIAGLAGAGPAIANHEQQCEKRTITDDRNNKIIITVCTPKPH